MALLPLGPKRELWDSEAPPDHHPRAGQQGSEPLNPSLSLSTEENGGPEAGEGGGGGLACPRLTASLEESASTFDGAPTGGYSAADPSVPTSVP